MWSRIEKQIRFDGEQTREKKEKKRAYFRTKDQ